MRISKAKEQLISFPLPTTPKVLLVDDDPIFCRVMQSYGRDLGIQVVAYCDFQEMSQGTFDLPFAAAIVDYDLGDITGLSFARLIQQRSDLYPIVLVSHYKRVVCHDWPPIVKTFLNKEIGAAAILQHALRLSK